MAIALVEPDPFAGAAKSVAAYVPHYTDYTTEAGRQAAESKGAAVKQLGASNRDEQALTSVARPIMGIQAKPNTHAYVQVVKSDGTVLQVFNQLAKKAQPPGDFVVRGDGAKSLAEQALATAGELVSAFTGAKPKPEPAAKSPGFVEGNDIVWTDWILQSVQEQRLEKTQIVETFGENYLYVFGEKPRTVNFQGLLMNTEDMPWRAVFWENWSRFFRATKLVEQDARVYIGWDDILLEGYPVNAAASDTAHSPNAISFSFSFFVTDYINLSAKSGFSGLDAFNIPLVQGGVADAGALQGLTSSRISILEMAGIGVPGANRLGLLAQEALGDSPWAPIVGSEVATMTLALQRGALATLAGRANALSFLRSLSFHTTNKAFQILANAATYHIEEGTLTGVKLKKGEVNAWFGLAGSILDRLGTTGTASEVLKRRTVRAITSTMAYNLINSAFSSVDARPHAVTAV